VPLSVGSFGDLCPVLGSGASMPHPSTWDKIRWRAWNRMHTHADHPAAPVLPPSGLS
jgi:hypothetical protein